MSYALTCETCHADFTDKYKSKRKYCSRQCFYNSEQLKHRFENRIKPKKIRFEKPCEVCKKPMFLIKANFEKTRFCNKDCMKVWQSSLISGEKNFFYKNGNAKKKRSYRGDDWGQLRRLVYMRDSYTCQSCGIHCMSRKDAIRQNETHKIIQCHHIIPFSKGGANDLENLTTLCLSCHMRIEQEISS